MATIIKKTVAPSGGDFTSLQSALTTNESLVFRKRKKYVPPTPGETNYRQPSPNMKPHALEIFPKDKEENEV